MGQSNAAGYQTPSDTNTYRQRKGQYIFNNVTQLWEPLQQNYNNGGSFQDYTGSIGVEMKLMELLHSHYGSDQFLFKYTSGGTPLAHKEDGELYDWTPDSSADYMFNGSVKSFRRAFNIFHTQIPPVKILIWIQGENDVSLERANQYQANFAAFIKELKNRWNTPTLKVLQTLLSDTQTAYNGLGKTIINEAKMNYSINGNKFVNIDGAEVADGGVHFTAEGQDYIAQKVFEVLKTML